METKKRRRFLLPLALLTLTLTLAGCGGRYWGPYSCRTSRNHDPQPYYGTYDSYDDGNGYGSDCYQSFEDYPY